MASSADRSDNLVCDVLIIGSGPIGAAFARTLCDGGRRVIMVEAGHHGSRRAGECRKNDWTYQRDLNAYGHFVRGQMFPVSVPPASVPSTLNALNPLQDSQTNLPGAVLSYSVGGMAVHWTCAIPRQHQTLERLDFIGDSEWRTLYERAERLLNRHDDVFSNSSRHKAVKACLEEHKYRAVDTPLAAERRAGSEFARFSGSDTVLGNLANTSPGYDPHAGFVLLPGHAVRRLVRDPGNDNRIVRAEVSDVFADRAFSISADTFVVAAGWLHTPQILWASGIHTHEESALGRYLHDHTFTATTIVLREEVLDRVKSEPDDVRPAAEDANDPAPLGISKREPPPHMYLPVSENQLWHGMIFRESFQFDPLPDDVDDRRILDLKWFGMIDPKKENRVEFSADGNRDRLGMPQPTFHVRLGEEDRHRMAEMMEHMKQVAEVLGTPLPGYEPREIPLGASTHTMGLTRMGPEDDDGRTSVIDPFSKVWGIDNLFVGGNCVLPKRNACNPTLTSMALALRSADAILRGHP